MYKVTVNTWPQSQKCIGCPLKGGLVVEQPGQVTTYGNTAYVCTRGEDAGTCNIPEALLLVKDHTMGISKSQGAAMLRVRRKIAANPHCTKCGGDGEIISLEALQADPTSIPEKCECTTKKR